MVHTKCINFDYIFTIFRLDFDLSDWVVFVFHIFLLKHGIDKPFHSLNMGIGVCHSENMTIFDCNYF